MRLIRNHLIPKTWIEWLVVVVIAAILVALLLPEPKWAASGSIEVPVRVYVFDAETIEPVEGAHVALIRGPIPGDRLGFVEYQDHFDSGWRAMKEGWFGETTQADGFATVECEIPTGSSHKNPESCAHASLFWILVSSDDHVRVAVPLRYQSIPTKSLREEGVLPVFVGVVRREVEEE
ncbi:MAG: hypothetical protein DWQ34_08380 [Planctomycetota bacterium]|nr:MAG: hypothetical protein DWQ34_08380 [Planctomycetota bacterium]REK31297.1 MAG: hypothetical protein DWQ41_00145 [Planctomycetota bacterium]REK37327.1 MAG: hypothetical protein DWQ45_07750 [Planctomycetota bacterium]